MRVRRRRLPRPAPAAAEVGRRRRHGYTPAHAPSLVARATARTTALRLYRGAEFRTVWCESQTCVSCVRHELIIARLCNYEHVTRYQSPFSRSQLKCYGRPTPWYGIRKCQCLRGRGHHGGVETATGFSILTFTHANFQDTTLYRIVHIYITRYLQSFQSYKCVSHNTKICIIQIQKPVHRQAQAVGETPGLFKL